MSQATITVVSTRTVDLIPKPETGGFEEVPGGPALYISAALDRLGCRYQLLTGAVARVEVIPTAEGEEYLIEALEEIALPERLSGDGVILSPVMREIDPHRVPPADGCVAIDLQGFVRQPGHSSGSSAEEVDLSDLLPRVQVIKGSEAELRRLNSQSRAAMEDAITIVTYGQLGATLRFSGQAEEIPAQRVPASHTIGAGDTFLAAFVYFLIRGRTPVEAGNGAARFTEEVLRERVKT